MLTRSGERSPEGAPQSASASAPISASAKSCTIARKRSGLACSSCLRNQLSKSIVLSTTVLLLARLRQDGARMTRWSAITGPAGQPSPSRPLHLGAASRRRSCGRDARTPPAGTLLAPTAPVELRALGASRYSDARGGKGLRNAAFALAKLLRRRGLERTCEVPVAWGRR